MPRNFFITTAALLICALWAGTAMAGSETTYFVCANSTMGSSLSIYHRVEVTISRLEDAAHCPGRVGQMPCPVSMKVFKDGEPPYFRRSGSLTENEPVFEWVYEHPADSDFNYDVFIDIRNPGPCGLKAVVKRIK